MNIPHRYCFIFVKTRKTAGTSAKVRLGAIAGEHAVVTLVDPLVPGQVARNSKVTSATERALLWRVRRRGRGTINAAHFNHISLNGIRRQLHRRRADSYVTFCFERDPWDTLVSGYFFAEGRGEFDGSPSKYILHGDPFDRIDLEHPTSLTREKGNYRPADARSDEVFGEETRGRVESVFACEMQAYGYRRPEIPATPPREIAPGSN